MWAAGVEDATQLRRSNHMKLDAGRLARFLISARKKKRMEEEEKMKDKKKRSKCIAEEERELCQSRSLKEKDTEIDQKVQLYYTHMYMYMSGHSGFRMASSSRSFK